MLTTSLIWGFAPPIIKYTLNFTSPLSFLFWRFLIVSLVLFIPLIFRLRKIKLSFKQLFNYFFLGFLATPLTLILLFEGIKRTSATDAAIISIIAPILIILGGAAFFKETVTKTEQIGIILVLLGTAITIIQPILVSGLNFGKNVCGNFLVLAGSISWAAFTLLSKKIKLDSFVLTAFSFLVGLVIIVPFFKPVIPPYSTWGGIFYMTIFGSVVAYFTYIYGFSKIEASEAAIFTYLQPIFAAPVAIIWLGEKITLFFIIGAAIIGLGVFLTEKR